MLHIYVSTSCCQWRFLMYHNSAKCNVFLGSLAGTSDSSCMPGVSCFHCGRESRGTRWHASGSALSSPLCYWSECLHCPVCMMNLTWPLNDQARMILDVESYFPHPIFPFMELLFVIQGDTKKQELLKNPTKKFYWQKLNHYNLPFKRQ